MLDINDTQSMKDFTLGIIETLHSEKKKRNIFPDNVTRNEILHFIRNKVERSLISLQEENKIEFIGEWTYENKIYKLKND